MNIYKRLDALEKRFIREPAILTMRDGTTATIWGHGDYLLELLGTVFHNEGISSGQAKQLDLIRRSTETHEPGGAHLTDLIRSLPLSPADGLEQTAELSGAGQ
jgi:hypothetical protein